MVAWKYVLFSGFGKPRSLKWIIRSDLDGSHYEVCDLPLCAPFKLGAPPTNLFNLLRYFSPIGFHSDVHFRIHNSVIGSEFCFRVGKIVNCDTVARTPLTNRAT